MARTGACSSSPSGDGSLGSSRSSARLRSFYRRSFRVSPPETLQHLHIPPVVPVILVWRFENERLHTQLGMRQDAAEAGRADVAFIDVGVPVHVRSQRRFGIV